ncbi:TPA: helix-turn-helix transcriptional regulator [Vibrio parahaemolyticus]|nr:helix-turn-helix transcriptional regulator [Vibrio parahaemolyticus]
MLDPKQAQRLKSAVLSRGTYEEISELIGISVSTLVRICAGKTDPKFRDIMKISNITGKSMDWICYGDAINQKQHADDTFLAANGTDYETNEAHRYVIWNLDTLDKQDIQAIATQVKALSRYRFKFRS